MQRRCWSGPSFPIASIPAPAWLAELPLPWWRIQGTAVAGKPLVFLDYGYVNYGQYIESTEIFRGPALLDLVTGRIAIARFGSSADSPVYDASSCRRVGAGRAVSRAGDCRCR